MTEEEWLACEDPTPMMEFLHGKASGRKLRLFAVACCRRIWHLFTDERSRCLVEKVEQYADGLVSIFDFSNAWDIHEDACATYDFKAPYFAAMFSFSDFQQTASAAAEAAGCGVWWASIPENDPIIDVVESAGRHAETEAQRRMLRDIFGNPFRPLTIDACWRNPTIARLAQTIYDDRQFADLPILADALEEAGCTDAAILEHCRRPGEHVRGCWVVDLLLGKF